MIRLARTASLLVAFFLLTSAATAYAECAWVLWQRSQDFSQDWTPRSPEKWTIEGTFERQSECRQDRDETMDKFEKHQDPPAVRRQKDNRRLLTNFYANGQLQSTNVVTLWCMPSGTDPRGLVPDR